MIKLLDIVFLRLSTKPPIYPTPTFGYIDNICVLNKYQKNGIGSLLLEDAIKWFKKKDINRIECFAATANIKSTSFWSKMGFKVFMEQFYMNL